MNEVHVSEGGRDGVACVHVSFASCRHVLYRALSSKNKQNEQTRRPAQLRSTRRRAVSRIDARLHRSNCSCYTRRKSRVEHRTTGELLVHVHARENEIRSLDNV